MINGVAGRYEDALRRIMALVDEKQIPEKCGHSAFKACYCPQIIARDALKGMRV